MDVSIDIDIANTREVVWQTITDTNQFKDMISSILAIEILNQPETGLKGLKWKETRLMFGKEASEVMWVTDSVENEYYCTRAESHGSIYLTRLSLTKLKDDHCKLTMTFEGQAQTIMMKILSVLMSPFIKSSMKKMLLKDLEEIKAYIESK